LMELSERLHALVHADIEAYQAVGRIMKLSKDSPERSRQLGEALDQATEVPMEIAERACQAGLLIHSCIPSAKPPVQSDLTVGMIMAIAAAEAGLHTVKINIKSQPNHEVNEKFQVRMGRTIRSLEELRGLCYTPPS
jgi:glutamate formiminotransferase / formiminotetrahydrofolate cyclodeaminase